MEAKGFRYNPETFGDLFGTGWANASSKDDDGESSSSEEEAKEEEPCRLPEAHHKNGCSNGG